MNADADQDFADVIAAELDLLSGPTRRDRDLLDQVIAPEFVEIGKSGRLWARDEIIDALAQDESTAEVQADEFAARLVAQNLVLLTFVTTVEGSTARRSSLWRKIDDGTWQTVFHQGTVVQGTVVQDTVVQGTTTP